MLTAAVIISARDSGRWLEQCLEAIARQRLPPHWRVRILLGIDACPSTLHIAKALKIPHLFIAYFPVHVGPYVIFNSLSYSGFFDALIRFDADDIMLDRYLEAQLTLVDSALSPTIIQTWSVYVDSHLHPVPAQLADGSWTPPDGRRTSTSDGQVLFTRAVLNRLGGFQTWWCHADTDFIQRALWSGVTRRVVREHLYLRRVHPYSLTQSSKTGYGSSMRRYYSEEIATARRRYLCGIPPVRLCPAVSGCFAAGSLP
jgi:hypothetical protein